MEEEMNIKTYLKKVVELEETLYTLNKSIGYLRYGQKNLGISRNYEAPKAPPELLGPVGLTIVFSVTSIIGASIIGVIFGIVGAANGNSFSSWFRTSSIIVFIGLFILLIIWTKNTQNNELNIYREEMKKHEILINQDKSREQEELLKRRNIDLQISAVHDKYNEIATTLKKLYDMNVLYPKYRNFIASATFYEYFDSGRCNSLEGHEGAYNIYENELRLNAILGKLNDIVNHLEEIRSSQYTIYNAISEGNKTANAIYQKSMQISDSMNNVADNSAITSYNSMIAARNTEVLKFIAVYENIK